MSHPLSILAYLNNYSIELLNSDVNPAVWQLWEHPSPEALNRGIWWVCSKSWSSLKIYFHCCNRLSVLQEPFQQAWVSCTSHHQHEMGLQLTFLGPPIFTSYHNQPSGKLTAFIGSTHRNLFSFCQQAQSQNLLFQLEACENRWSEVSCFTLDVLYQAFTLWIKQSIWKRVEQKEGKCTKKLLSKVTLQIHGLYVYCRCHRKRKWCRKEQTGREGLWPSRLIRVPNRRDCPFAYIVQMKYMHFPE